MMYKAKDWLRLTPRERYLLLVAVAALQKKQRIR